MRTILQRCLSMLDGEYADVRYERVQRIKCEIRGKEISEKSVGTCNGFVMRLLKSGAFSSVSFNSETEAERAARVLLANVRAASAARMVEGLEIPEPVCEEVPVRLDEDPRDVSMDEKMLLLSEYNNIVMGFKKMMSTLATYEEVWRERYFLNSRGGFLAEPLVTSSITVRMIAGEGGVFQNAKASVGGSDGFYKLRRREDVFEKKANVVVRLLKADPVVDGVYDVVLNQEMTGVFIHEAFGHFSEADLLERNPSMKARMKLGSLLGSEVLNVVDDPTLEGQVGRYRYDDEGVKAKRVVLMEAGVLKARLHSMRTAFSYGEPLTGHCVAEDARFPPLVRMGCIHVTGGGLQAGELFEKADDGLYVLDAKGGQTSGEYFTFGAQYGFLIRKGRLDALVRDINLMGNLFHTMKNVEAVAGDVVIGETGGCFKGQMNIRSAMGGPHILIRGVRVGGVRGRYS